MYIDANKTINQKIYIMKDYKNTQIQNEELRKEWQDNQTCPVKQRKREQL